jgi:hypothetical protein
MLNALVAPISKRFADDEYEWLTAPGLAKSTRILIRQWHAERKDP